MHNGVGIIKDIVVITEQGVLLRTPRYELVEKTKRC